jgi:hypothetical protein
LPWARAKTPAHAQIVAILSFMVSPFRSISSSLGRQCFQIDRDCIAFVGAWARKSSTRTRIGLTKGPRGFIDNNSDWGGASPLNWRLGIRIGARNRKTGALPNGRSCRRRLACRFKFTRSGFLPGSGGAHLREREATRSEARRGWDGVGQLPGALLHFHLGKADLRYVVKMTSDGIDPAAVTYSDAIYKSVCDL